MLQRDFVPVAFDQWYLRRQQDAEGEFYRKIARQGPRNDFNKTTQGFYIAEADGKLLAFNNNRGPKRIKQLMQTALANNQLDTSIESIDVGKLDPQYDRRVSSETTVIRVNAKVLGGYEKNRFRIVSLEDHFSASHVTRQHVDHK